MNKKNVVKKIQKNQYVPLKNYVLATILFLGVIFLFLYAFSWYNVKNKEKLLESYLVKTNTVSLIFKNLNEVDTIFKEPPAEFFIYIGYTNDKNVYALEKNLKPLIDSYNIHDKFYYLNITNIKTEKNYLEKLNDKLKTNIYTTPAIIYYVNNKVEDKIESNNTMITANQFENLLDIYDFEKSE